MYAIFQHGGKQYKVCEGDYLKLDHFTANSGDSIEINEILAICDNEIKVGTPFLSGAKITLQVINEGKDRKIIIFKKRRRKDSKRKRGFRRQYTRVKVESIKA